MRNIIKNMAVMLVLVLALTLVPVSLVLANENAIEDYDEKTKIAKKSVSVNLDEDYSSIQFSITCADENAKEYSYSLVSPSQEKIVIPVSEDGLIQKTVENTLKGTWTVVVCDNGVLEGSSSIGQVSISVKKVSASVEDYSEDSLDVNNGVNVKKELSGLKLYFKDDSLVAEWSDESVSTVNVRVFDTESQEVFANTVVSDKSIEVPIPEITKQVTISLVPSTEQNVEGEEQQYTLFSENNPNAEIMFSDIKDTNQPSLSYRADLHDTYSIACYLNGTLVDEKKNLASGEYDLSVNLQEGANDVKVYVIDSNGYMRSTSKSINLDTKAPVLMIESNYDGVQTTDSSITFTGKVEEYDSLTLNNKTAIDVNYDGTFTVKIDLKEGENKFLISAKDKAGNEAQYTAVITRIVERFSIDAEILVSAFFFVLSILIVFLIIGKRRKSEEEYIYVDEDGNEVELTSDMEVIEEVSDDGEKQLSNFERLFQNLESKKKEVKKEEKKKRKSLEKWAAPVDKCNVEIPDEDEYAGPLQDVKEKRKFVRRKEPVTKRQILKLLLFFILPIAVILCVVNYTLSFGSVASGSMEPTIMTGDYTVACKVSYMIREPKRGDIVHISGHAEDNKVYLKRIIGLPGDHIEFKDGYVYINKAKCVETYLSDDVETNCTKEFDVPEDCYFVLGDNRENSDDSRYWENPYVSNSQLSSKVLFYFSLGGI